MAMQWVDDVRQTALLDEAEQLAVRHLQAPFAPIRALYTTCGFDVAVFATQLRETVTAARAARAEQQAAQNRYEFESEERRSAAADVGDWIRLLHLAARVGRSRQHPMSDMLYKLAFSGELAPESWSQSVDGLAKVLVNLRRVGDLSALKLPPGFVEQGEAYVKKLQSERNDAAYAESERFLATLQLDALMVKITAAFEVLDQERAYAMELTGETIPGLELALVRGAAAPRSSRDAAEPTEPVPSMVSSVVLPTNGPVSEGDTGL